jgi:hypothetical protein
MKRLLQMVELQLKRSRGTSTLAIMTWILGANVAGAIGQHLNQIIVGAISDSIESQVLQSVSLLAGMNGSGFDCDFHCDPGCGRRDRWRVARDLSQFSFENVFGTEIGADKHSSQIVIDPSVVAKSEDLRCKKS